MTSEQRLLTEGTMMGCKFGDTGMHMRTGDVLMLVGEDPQWRLTEERCPLCNSKMSVATNPKYVLVRVIRSCSRGPTCDGVAKHLTQERHVFFGCRACTDASSALAIGLAHVHGGRPTQGMVYFVVPKDEVKL